MAPYSASRSAPTTPQSHIINLRTPSSASKHRPVSLINRLLAQSPCPPQPPLSSDHPVEVVARIRDHPDGSDNLSVLQITQNGQTVRIRTDQGYRDFGLDGVSLAEAEDLHSFYKTYVESRIESVKAGGRCTIMMYGPTGAGKSHTMFGSAKEPGIAYRALQNILGGSSGSLRVDEKYCSGSPDYSVKKTKVTVSILEIYNEDIFDLLAGSNTPNGHWIRPQLSRARLEIMGKKAKNAVSITGTDAEKIAKEIAKVEKRRVVKSTSCNERSSRSHCVVMLDVPALGGRLVLVDMAGSENLEQAGLGMDSKMQTGKINQGNIALKRVVEAIANGDSYIPFRDSKLTMLLQDSFEDDEAKILMILCASPDPKDMHKTIATLEYGCKAKCIVSLPKSPAKERFNNLDLSVLEARVRAMDAHISKLEAENQSKDKEKEEMIKELRQKEQDLAALKKALEQMEQEPKERCSKCCNDDVRVEMESRIKECQKVAEEVIAMGKKKLEEKIAEQQREIDHMRSRMKEIEREVELFLKVTPEGSGTLHNSRNGDQGIVSKVRGVLKSLSATNKENSENPLPSNLHNNLFKVDVINESNKGGEVLLMQNRVFDNSVGPAQQPCESHENPTFKSSVAQDDLYVNSEGIYDPNRWLPIIPEEESEGEEEMMADDDEDHPHKLHPVVSLEKTGRDTFPALPVEVHSSSIDDHETIQDIQMDIDECHSEQNAFDRSSTTPVGPSAINMLSSHADVNLIGDNGGEEAAPVSATSRRSRIENIFLLCGNHRELAAANTQKQSHETMSHYESKHALDQGSEGIISIDHQLGSHIANIGEASFLGLPASSPSKLQASPLNFKESSGSKIMKGGDRSPARFLSTKTRHPFSENTPPLSTTCISHYAKSPTMHSFEDSSCSASEANAEKNSSQLDADMCEVYVKWETSKESSGKLINILTTKRSTSLAELRRELQKHVASVTQDFTFLMLGDPSGAPVERENESRLLVMSLPNCHKQRGTKLACLRPQLKHNAESQGPLCPLENQMTWNTSKPVTPSPHKSPLGFNSVRPTDKASVVYQGGNLQKTHQRLSFPLISQVKGLRL